MPAPSKTSDAEIVSAALQLLESRGPDRFSMTDVANAVGVRTPSLYGRFADRKTLIDAVEVEQWRALGRRLHAVTGGREPHAVGTGREAIAVLTMQARAYRTFAKANPAAYALMFRIDADRSEAGQAARAAAVAASLPAFAALVGERDALEAARVLTPFLHGFVSMEIAGAFRLGAGVDAAFERGVATILRGLAPRSRRTTSRGTTSRGTTSRRTASRRVASRRPASHRCA